VFFVIGHRATAVSTSRSSANLRPNKILLRRCQQMTIAWWRFPLNHYQLRSSLRNYWPRILTFWQTLVSRLLLHSNCM